MNKMYAQFIHGITYRGGVTWIYDNNGGFIPYKCTALSADPDIWLVQHPKWKTTQTYAPLLSPCNFKCQVETFIAWTKELLNPNRILLFGAAHSNIDGYIEFDASVLCPGKYKAAALAKTWNSEYIWNPIRGAQGVNNIEIIETSDSVDVIKKAMRHRVVP